MAGQEGEVVEEGRSLPPIREFADRGVQWLLETPENVRGLLTVVAADIARCLDFARMVREPATMIPDNLRKQEADLVFRVPYRDGPQERDVLIYLLIEHQSSPDAAMGFRVLFDMVNLWDRQRRAWREQDLPESQWRFLPILPVVFYTGSARWEMPLDLVTLMDLPQALSRFVPRHETLLLNLKATPPEALTAADHPFGWLLRVIQKEGASAEELEAALVDAVAHLDAMMEEERGGWEKAIYFLYLLIYHRRAPGETRALADRVTDEVRRRGREETAEMAQTMAEALVEEGIEKGILLGTLRAKQDDVLGLLVEKFGPVPEAVATRVRNTDDVALLDVYLRRIIRADSLEAMGLPQ